MPRAPRRPPADRPAPAPVVPLPRPRHHARDMPEQLDLPKPPAAAKPPARVAEDDPATLAKRVVAKRYQRGSSGRLRIPLTLFLEGSVIERLTERALREQRSLADLVEEILTVAVKR